MIIYGNYNVSREKSKIVIKGILEYFFITPKLKIHYFFVISFVISCFLLWNILPILNNYKLRDMKENDNVVVFCQDFQYIYIRYEINQ